MTMMKNEHWAAWTKLHAGRDDKLGIELNLLQLQSWGLPGILEAPSLSLLPLLLLLAEVYVQLHAAPTVGAALPAKGSAISERHLCDMEFACMRLSYAPPHVESESGARYPALQTRSAELAC